MDLLAVHLQHGQLAGKETTDHALLPLVFRSLGQQQMADHDGDGRIDQLPAGKIEIGRAFRLDERYGLDNALPGLEQLLL